MEHIIRKYAKWPLVLFFPRNISNARSLRTADTKWMHSRWYILVIFMSATNRWLAVDHRSLVCVEISVIFHFPNQLGNGMGKYTRSSLCSTVSRVPANSALKYLAQHSKCIRLKLNKISEPKRLTINKILFVNNNLTRDRIASEASLLGVRCHRPTTCLPRVLPNKSVRRRTHLHFSLHEWVASGPLDNQWDKQAMDMIASGVRKIKTVS